MGAVLVLAVIGIVLLFLADRFGGDAGTAAKLFGWLFCGAAVIVEALLLVLDPADDLTEFLDLHPALAGLCRFHRSSSVGYVHDLTVHRNPQIGPRSHADAPPQRRAFPADAQQPREPA